MSKKLTIEYYKEITKKFGGECLSTSYEPGDILTWHCPKHNYTWNQNPKLIFFAKRKAWCKICYLELQHNNRPNLLNIEAAQSLAESRGGKCLSAVYINALSKLKWECGEKHQFEMSYANVYANHWCYQCSSSLGERICREVFEKLFDKKFPKGKPKWLGQQEFDGFCEELNLAFEHHGDQHYKCVFPFTQTKERLQTVKRRDAKKARLAKKHGITLIIIPELRRRTKIKDIRQLIGKACEKAHFELPDDFWDKEITICEAFKSPNINNDEKLLKLKQDAFDLGFELLSTIYVDSQSKVKLKCIAHKIEFEQTPSGLRRGKRSCYECRSGHGTDNMYRNHNCRCDLCVAFMRKTWKENGATKKLRASGAV